MWFATYFILKQVILNINLSKKMKKVIRVFLSICLSFCTVAQVSAKDWYISNAGTGKEATKAAPAKEIGAISDMLQPGDVIHVAGGEYKGKLNNGSDILNVPVSIIGGYNATFTARDPWGASRSIFTGVDEYMKPGTARLGIMTEKTHKEYSGEVLFDGLIIDNGSRNFYHKENLILARKAPADQSHNASPESPAIHIRMASNANVIIRNCVMMNVGASQGVIDIQLGKASKALIENNLIINNTGEGIFCKTAWQSDTDLPTFKVRNNTIAFTWKHDAISTFGGNAIKLDTRLVATIENNVFAFSDYGGVDNIKVCKNLTLNNNLFTANKKYDYRENNDGMLVSDMGDYAACKNSGNHSALIKVSLEPKWAALYFGRKEISRGEIEKNVHATNSDANAIRAMLGLAQQAGSVSTDAEVWLHKIALEDAMNVGMKNIEGKGCKKP